SGSRCSRVRNVRTRSSGRCGRASRGSAVAWAAVKALVRRSACSSPSIVCAPRPASDGARCLDLKRRGATLANFTNGQFAAVCRKPGTGTTFFDSRILKDSFLSKNRELKRPEALDRSELLSQGVRPMTSASTSRLKQIAKMTLRLAALTQLALFSAAACSSDNVDRSFSSVACSTAAQCKSNENCVNSVCTAIPTGSAGHGNVAAAGNGSVAAAGNGAVLGTAGAAGTGTAGSGTGGSGTVGTAGSGTVGTAGSGTAGSGTTGTAGSGSVGTGGPGYWTSKDWHGCSWTGVGTDGTSTITPKDFTA